MLEEVLQSTTLQVEIVLACVALYYLYRWFSGTYCVFSFQQLEESVRIAKQKQSKDQFDLKTFFEDIRAEIALRYPGHVAPKLEWVWCHAGGCLWSFAVIHVSLTEYLIFTGSGSGTDGLTGRHIARISDIVLHGRARYTDEDAPYIPIFFQAGDTFHLAPLETQSLHIPDEFWLLEHGRGFVPLLLPFGLAGSVFATVDVVSILRTFWVYGKFMAVYALKWPFLSVTPQRPQREASV